MSKFNEKRGIETVNRSGHAAYNMDAKSKLITQVLTSFFNENKFYSDNSDEMREIIKTVIQSDPGFVSHLAVFARREFNMRSVSHVLTAYLAHEEKGKPFVRKITQGVTVRGDDVTEIMAFYLATFGKPIPNSLKKGVADVLTGFDEYTLAKYKGAGKAVKMRDLLCLCRPTPKDENQSALWKRVLENKLQTPLTWETELSKKGNNAETWEYLIESEKVGYMALLRNLKNIIQANPANIEKVWRHIENPDAVRKSRQLPFRFLSAYKSIANIAGSRAFDALENAAESSVANMPRLPGTTVIAVDVSGSMGDCLSAKSSVKYVEIATMLGLIANQICDNAIFYKFNNEIEKIALSHRSGILQEATRAQADGWTSMELPFIQMIRDKIQADRVIILSDNECNSNFHGPVQRWADKYRLASGKMIWVHAVDLQGYGTQQFYGQHTNLIAGWSEKIFQFIPIAEQGDGNLLKAIQNYKW